MDSTQSKSNSDNQNSQKTFCKQPITCPWIANQPYPSTLNKNRASDSTPTKPLANTPLSVESRTINEKTCPSLQHSSSQFFYFLRLMQLFPETHPATLHTVLCLCKNDFFCAVDKLLYAKRCKALYSRSQGMFKRCSGRSHPYCVYGGTGKVIGQHEKAKCNETMTNANMKETVDVQNSSDIEKVQLVIEDNLDAIEETSDFTVSTEENQCHIDTVLTTSATVIIHNKENNKTDQTDDVTSPDNSSQVQEIKCDKVSEV